MARTLNESQHRKLTLEKKNLLLLLPGIEAGNLLIRSSTLYQQAIPTPTTATTTTATATAATIAATAATAAAVAVVAATALLLLLLSRLPLNLMIQAY